MSTTTKPVWRTATAHKEDDFDAIWLYENTWEWTFSEENGAVTLHYLSSKVMPERNGASRMSGYELSSGDYNALVDFVENISFYYLMQLGEEDKKKILPLIIKMLLFQGFDLPTVVSVWNDVIEGKE